MPATLVDTAKAPRRDLDFKCFGCVARELERIDAAHRSGALRTTGNWSSGQILDHCAIIIEHAVDGAPKKAPLIARVFGRFMKGKMLKPGTMPPGFKLPKGASHLLPAPGVTYEQGLTRIRTVLKRVERGARMDKPSAWMGPLTHEEWERLNCNHMQLHFGFMAY